MLATVGFGVLIHKVAKLRTAEDVAAGEETHPESVWVSNVKHSDGVLPELGKVGDGARAVFSGNRAVEQPVEVGSGASPDGSRARRR